MHAIVFLSDVFLVFFFFFKYDFNLISMFTEMGGKQWCILYSVLLIALGTGVSVGVPLALRSSSSLHDRLNTVHNILAQVPLVDG